MFCARTELGGSTRHTRHIAEASRTEAAGPGSTSSDASGVVALRSTAVAWFKAPGSHQVSRHRDTGPGVAATQWREHC